MKLLLTVMNLPNSLGSRTCAFTALIPICSRRKTRQACAGPMIPMVAAICAKLSRFVARSADSMPGFQAAKVFRGKTRAALPRFEEDEGRLKINPLADWDKARLDAYFEDHKLPRHPLEKQGYLSIGCAPCTSKVQPGEDPRAGRWRGWDKDECGIHTDIANDPIF